MSFWARAKGEEGMSKYFSMALFYTEKKNIISSFVAYVVLYFFATLGFIQNLNLSKTQYNYMTPDPTWFIVNSFYYFIAISITSVVYSYLEKDKKYYFMLTQGYSRSSIIVTKTLSFMISCILPTIMYTIINFFLVIANKHLYFKEYIDGQFVGQYYHSVTSRLFLGAFCIIAVVTFITALVQFLQMCFGKSLAALLLPCIMWILLALSINVASGFISRKLGSLRDFIYVSSHFLFGPGTSILHHGTAEYKSLMFLVHEYFSNFNLLVSILLLLASILLFSLTITVNRRIKAEATSNIFLFKFSENIFKAVFSLFITIAGTLFIAAVLYYMGSIIPKMNLSTYLINEYGLAGKENIEHTIYLILNMLWIPLAILVYKLMSRILNKRGAL
jgi:hypothetical protein